jgi:AraC-like DNA-binding protein
MRVEFNHTTIAGNLAAIDAAINIPLKDGILQVPPDLGKGYVQEIVIDSELLLLIRQYELKEELILNRKGNIEDGRNVIVMAFHDLYRLKESTSGDNLPFPAVQITTAETEYEDVFPSQTRVNTFIIMIHVNLLRTLLNPKDESGLLKVILSGKHSFLFEELISPDMQQIADQILSRSVTPELQPLFFRIKAEELIFLLFTELIKREHLAESPININDVKIIYSVRDRIIADLGINPRLTELARFSGMSESKIKRLFKQVFGASIYNYYQAARMDQAAYLIKESGLSVSEAVYRVGFTNLSHFSRTFESLKGITPKKYSKMA